MIYHTLLIILFVSQAMLARKGSSLLADRNWPQLSYCLKSFEIGSWISILIALSDFTHPAPDSPIVEWLGVTGVLFLMVNVVRNLYWWAREKLFGGQQIGAVRDVGEDSAYLQTLSKAFNPEQFIDLRKGVFVGLDGQRKPAYLPQMVLDKNHIDILGESGVGKSSLAGVLLSQLAAAGETVVIFDPKCDEKLPGVLARAGQEWGDFPVHVIDLRPRADFAQLNPFAGCRPDQVEELLQVALELGKTGDGAVDFYRGKDREATGFVAEALEDGKTSMPEIICCASRDERVTEQENLWRELRQLGRVKALHTEGGLSLDDVLSKPGVLYVIGSTTRLEVVAAQKLILQRILQILDEREDKSRPVALFLDELKYLLSPAALRAAGTIRDRNCHLIFAHQSLGDLDDCAGLNPKAVRGAIWGNCGIKVVYKMQDTTAAKELEVIAGEVAAVATSSSKSDQGETISTRIDRVKHMPAHVFTHLPKPVAGEASVGVVFGLGTAFYLSTRWLPGGSTPVAQRAAEPAAVPMAQEADSDSGLDDEAPTGMPSEPSVNIDDLEDILKS